jgi:carboxyl-terminal processing protease
MKEGKDSLAHQSPVTTEKKMTGSLAKYFVAAVVAFSIFSFGVGIGDGRIKIGTGSIRVTKANSSLPDTLDFSSVNEVYSALKQNYDGQIDKTKLLDSIKEGIAKAAGDPYTEYFNPDGAKQFSEDLNGTFTGIGVEIGKDKDNNIVVISPISGFPGDIAGLKSKDVITEVDGKSVNDMSVSDVVKMIRGPKDTKVKIKVFRAGKDQLSFEITRDQITIPSVDYKILDGNIGYMKISRFGDDTTSLAQKAAKSFKDAKVKGIILDLRGDPGGLLESAVDVSSLWLENKTVLDERRDGQTIKTYGSRGEAVLKGIPTIVMIDAGSASASEITAGALKDNGAAQLLGDKSYGKGSVQQLQQLPSGGVLKVTIARWYTPAGKNIDKEGITPDIKIVPTDDDIKQAKDVQKDKALELLKK